MDKEFIKAADLRRVLDAVIAKYGEGTRVMVAPRYEDECAIACRIIGVNMGSENPPRLDIEVGSGEVDKVFASDACLTGSCKDCGDDIDFGEEQCDDCYIETHGGYPDWVHEPDEGNLFE